MHFDSMDYSTISNTMIQMVQEKHIVVKEKDVVCQQPYIAKHVMYTCVSLQEKMDGTASNGFIIWMKAEQKRPVKRHRNKQFRDNKKYLFHKRDIELQCELAGFLSSFHLTFANRRYCRLNGKLILLRQNVILVYCKSLSWIYGRKNQWLFCSLCVFFRLNSSKIDPKISFDWGITGLGCSTTGLSWLKLKKKMKKCILFLLISLVTTFDNIALLTVISTELLDWIGPLKFLEEVSWLTELLPEHPNLHNNL